MAMTDTLAKKAYVQSSPIDRDDLAAILTNEQGHPFPDTGTISVEGLIMLRDWVNAGGGGAIPTIPIEYSEIDDILGENK